MAKVISKKRRVQSPVACVITSIGFAPKLLVSALNPSPNSGPRQARKTTTLNQRIIWSRIPTRRQLKILLQVHSAVQPGHLIVAVEHQRRSFQELSQAPFFRLAPTRMIHVGIHVGIEAVFIWRHSVPGVHWLRIGEAQPNDVFGSFESILPRPDDA